MYLYTKEGMKTPNPDKSEVLVIRLSKKTKNALKELAKKPKYKNNSSAVIRDLIESQII